MASIMGGASAPYVSLMTPKSLKMVTLLSSLVVMCVDGSKPMVRRTSALYLRIRYLFLHTKDLLHLRFYEVGESTK